MKVYLHTSHLRNSMTASLTMGNSAIRRVAEYLLRTSRSSDARLRIAAWTVVLLGAARALSTLYNATLFTQGDFFNTLPGPLAEQLNLTLWDSPDWEGGNMRHRHLYLYGPVQYLTLFPLVFLNSYAEIADTLLVVYTIVIGGTILALQSLGRLLCSDRRRHGTINVFVAGTCLLFLPLSIALIQREFEIVQLFVITLGAVLILRGRDIAGASAIAFTAFFKLWPCIYLPYFCLRRRWSSVIASVSVLALVVLATHIVLDLAYFRTFFSLDMHLRSKVLSAFSDDGSFCRTPNGTVATLRMGVCAIAADLPDAAAKIGFYILTAIIAATASWSFVLLERRNVDLSPADARWRSLIELSLVTMAGALWIHGHYYYWCVILIPFVGLIGRYSSSTVPRLQFRILMLVLSYTFVSGFVIPPVVLSRATGSDFWVFYMNNGLYLYGGLILTFLLLWDYVELARRSASGSRATT